MQVQFYQIEIETTTVYECVTWQSGAVQPIKILLFSCRSRVSCRGAGTLGVREKE